jgi:NADP-dependent 3-hydroxy acid dehydrogenase YdfG
VEGVLEVVDALSSAELADLVACVTSRPGRVDLRQIVAPPSRQV